MNAEVANEAVEVVRGLVYARRGDRELKADLYLPGRSGSSRPAVIWLHGGGWRFGNRRQAPDLVKFYARRGYVMVSIDYSLSTAAVFPAAVEDVNTAIRWVRSIASEYGIDTQRVALWGSSAGGHLAALSCIAGEHHFRGEEHAQQSNRVAAVVAAYAPSDFSQMDAHRDPEGKPSDDAESIQLPAGKLTADADSLESLFLGAPVDTVPEKVRAANPITYMRGDLPPFLLLHGNSDTAVPRHQSELLYQALAAAGDDVSLALIDRLGHGFLNRSTLDDREWQIELLRPGLVSEVRQARIFELIEGWMRQRLNH